MFSKEENVSRREKFRYFYDEYEALVKMPTRLRTFK
jgi:hypothetical protein